MPLMCQVAREIYKPNKPFKHVDKAQLAINKRVTEAAGPRAVSGLAVAFEHPRANRQVRLGETLVGFEFRRGRRRTIGFSVGPLGLVVSAPQGVPLQQVDAAVQDKARWIVQKLHAARQRHEQLAAQRTVWQDGATFAYLGQPVTVSLVPPQASGARRKMAPVLLTLPGNLASTAIPPSTVSPAGHTSPVSGPVSVQQVLQISLPLTADGAHIQAAVQRWLIEQARPLFVARLDHFAPLLQVQWRHLALSNAATRWGSARAGGDIRLNWRLMHFPLPVIDYVVVHELSHLRVMDHSPRFWAVVASVLPHYAGLRQQLKDDAMPRWM